jgi:hypothetical protein
LCIWMIRIDQIQMSLCHSCCHRVSTTTKYMDAYKGCLCSNLRKTCLKRKEGSGMRHDNNFRLFS